MPVLYGGVSIRPAPQVAIAVSYETVGDGRALGSTVTARVTGTIVAEKTNDTITHLTIDHRLSTLLAKMAALRTIFNENGKVFEVFGYDSSPPVQFNAIVDSIDFSEGGWTDVTQYTITLHGDGISGENANNTHCESASDAWTYEEGDQPRTWKATHTVSAKGKLVYDPDGHLTIFPWQRAKAFVTTQLGLGWAAAGAPAWVPASGITLASTSAVVPPTTAWDRHIVETQDELEGTYSIVETWTLNPNSYFELYTISVRRTDEPNVTTTASLSGSVTGLRSTMGINDDKYNAALAQWPTIQTAMLGRCQDAVSSVGGNTLSIHPVSVNVDHNRFEGTITYQYEFDDKTYVNDTYEDYTTSQSISDEDYKTTVRVEGTITGAVYLDDGPSKTIKFTRASLQWEIVRAILFVRAVQESGINSLEPFPVTAQVTESIRNGTVQYVYEFDDRSPANVRNEYTVSSKFTIDDGRTNVTIEGVVTGLRSDHQDNPFGTGTVGERFTNAVNYFAGISGNLLGMASQYVTLNCINPLPISTNVGYNPLAGTVSYSSEFSSRVTPVTPGALSEVISQTDDAATEVIAILPILGRRQGPILQDLGTVKEKRRTLNVEIVMKPPQYQCTPTINPPTFNITPYIPTGSRVFLDQDSTTWAEQQGRYSRILVWIYES